VRSYLFTTVRGALVYLLVYSKRTPRLVRVAETSSNSRIS